MTSTADTTIGRHLRRRILAEVGRLVHEFGGKPLELADLAQLRDLIARRGDLERPKTKSAKGCVDPWEGATDANPLP